jgi:hypothetical protein
MPGKAKSMLVFSSLRHDVWPVFVLGKFPMRNENVAFLASGAASGR